MSDDRTVLHALPEDQPDGLGRGSKSRSVHGDASGDGKPTKPTESDTKADWVTYADFLGVETSGMTKAQIIDSVDG